MDAENPREYSVGEVASMHGITVRTLHHWEHKGLITPERQWHNGYRHYSEADLEKVTAILGYRAIGMSLDAIGSLMREGPRHSVEHLLAQRQMLQTKMRSYGRMLAILDQLLEDAMAPMSEQLTAAEKAEIMGGALSPEDQRQAQERYGHTDDWAEYERRSALMTRSHWQDSKRELDAVEQALAQAFNRGVVPGSDEANELAERHRASLFFFDVTHAKHVILARGYVADARFAEHYNRLAQGLAPWLRSIIDANARAHGVNPQTASWC